MIIKVLPTFENPNRSKLVGALAHIWVKTNSREQAIKSAMEYIKKEHWEFQSWDKDAIETTLEQFEGKPQAIDHYLIALAHGIAAFFVGYEKVVEKNYDIN